MPRMRTLSTALCLLLVLSLHAPLAAQQASAPPASEALSGTLYGPQRSARERRAEEAMPAHDEPNWSLIGPGIGALGAGWLLGWITTAIWVGVAGLCNEHPATLAMPVGTTCPSGPESRGLWQMGVPLLGPWLSVAENTFQGTDVVFPVLMGILQPVGVALIAIGIATPRHVAARPAQAELHVGLSSLALEVHF